MAETSQDIGYRWQETCRGVVYPWHLDHLGHMNVQHYTGFFDQGSFHLLSMLGFSFHDQDKSGVTLVDAQHTINFLQEQLVGSLIVVESALARIGTKSLTYRHRMKNTETGAIAATAEVVSVCFDLKARKSIVVPDSIRERIAPFLPSERDGTDS